VSGLGTLVAGVILYGKWRPVGLRWGFKEELYQALPFFHWFEVHCISIALFLHYLGKYLQATSIFWYGIKFYSAVLIDTITEDVSHSTCLIASCAVQVYTVGYNKALFLGNWSFLVIHFSCCSATFYCCSSNCMMMYKMWLLHLRATCIKISMFVCLHYIQLKEYKVVGRMMPTPKMRTPPIYQMRIFAADRPQAKSRFWYYASMLRKVKKTQGEILCCSQVVDWYFDDVN